MTPTLTQQTFKLPVRNYRSSLVINKKIQIILMTFTQNIESTANKRNPWQSAVTGGTNLQAAAHFSFSDGFSTNVVLYYMVYERWFCSRFLLGLTEGVPNRNLIDEVSDLRPLLISRMTVLYRERESVRRLVLPEPQQHEIQTGSLVTTSCVFLWNAAAFFEKT